MAKRALTVETACPHCGHSPIPAEAERCPGCYRAFRVASAGWLAGRNNDREAEPSEGMGGTRIGGLDLLTSDAEAHPGTMSAALAALGLYALAASAGLLPGEPGGYRLLGLGELALGACLLAVPAFARPLVIVSTPLQVGAWLYLGRAALTQPTTLAVALLPLLVLAGVTGATGPRRRSLALAVVLTVTGFSASLRAFGGPPPGARGTSDAAGLRLQLPGGYALLHSPEKLSEYLGAPAQLDPRLRIFAFGSAERAVGGFWSVAPAGSTSPRRLAEAMAVRLGNGSDARAVQGDLTALDHLPQVHFEVSPQPGRVIRVSGLKLPDARTALLVVAAPVAELEGARQALAAGVEFAAAPAVHR